MNEDNILMLLTGPVSALALAISMLWGISKIIGKYLPKLVDKHLKQIDEQIESTKRIVDRLEHMRDDFSEYQTAQSEVTRNAVAGIHKRLNPIENDIKEVKTFLKLDNLTNNQ